MKVALWVLLTVIWIGPGVLVAQFAIMAVTDLSAKEAFIRALWGNLGQAEGAWVCYFMLRSERTAPA